MHPRFFDMVTFAASRGIKVSTNSNLTLFSRRRAEQCITSGLDTVHVSVDGSSRETYEKIRVGADWNKVIGNIRLLQNAKKAMAAEHPHIRLVFVLMRMNLGELPGLVTMAAELGISEIFVQHLCHDFKESTLPVKYRSMQAFVNDETLLNEDEAVIENQFALARAAAAAAGIALRLPSPRPPARALSSRGRERCDWPWRGMYLSFDGRSMPCCMIATPDRFNFGSGFEEGAREIWNSARYDEFRSRLESDDPPDICRSCSVYNGMF